MTSQSGLGLIICDGIYDRPGLFALRISNGKFSEIEQITQDEVSKLLGAQPPPLDLRGKIILPGFVDSHVHLIGSALYSMTIDLASVKSLDDIFSIIQVNEHTIASFILAGRLDVSKLKPEEREKFPSFLESAFDMPILIRSVEHHSAFLNRLAWERLEVEKLADELQISKRELSRMRSLGRISGKLYEALAERLYDEFSEEDKKRCVEDFLKTLPPLGVTCVHCLEGYGSNPETDFKVILDVNERKSEIDLVLYPRTLDVGVVKKYALPRIGGCILIDGAVGARTAAFSSEYNDSQDNFGIIYFSDEKLKKLIHSCASEKIQLAVHAIGDSAIEQVLCACEEVAKLVDLEPLRIRIEHLCGGTREQIERAGKLGITSGMQPAFDHFFGGRNGVYASALGEERALRMNPIRTAFCSKMKIGGGSDSPITPLNPALGIYSACNHNNPSERLSFQEAVCLFTEGSAYLACEENLRGKIEKGYLADYVVFSKGLNGENILASAPLLTVKSGIITYNPEEAHCS